MPETITKSTPVEFHSSDRPFAFEIDQDRLQKVMGRANQRRVAKGPSGGSSYRRGGVVSSEVMAETMTWNKGCRCEEMGLRAGMPVDELIDLEGGCTSTGGVLNYGWVCQRLDTIRRRYGR